MSKHKLTPRQKEWKREIKNLKARLRSRTKRYLPNINIVIPEMPKRITAKDIEELKKIGRTTIYERKALKLSKELKRKKNVDFFGVGIDKDIGEVSVTNEYDEYEESYDGEYDVFPSVDAYENIVLSNALNKIDEIYDVAVRDMLHSAFMSVYQDKDSRRDLIIRLEEASYLSALQGIIWYETKEEQYANAQDFLEVIKGEPLNWGEIEEVGQVIDESKKMKFGTFKTHKIHNVDRIIKDISENGRIKYNKYDKQALMKAMKEIVANPERYSEDTVYRAKLWIKINE